MTIGSKREWETIIWGGIGGKGPRKWLRGKQKEGGGGFKKRNL